MELIFRIGLTIGFTFVWWFSVRWVWTHQLDPKATISRISEKALAPPDWVARRDSHEIYRGGKAIGDIIGFVKQTDVQVHFGRLANTGGFDREKTFEFQRLKLRVLRVGSMMGMQIDNGQALTGVLEDVDCEIVK